VFEAALRLLSPFMPFLTEELWHAVHDSKPPAKSIALTRFPRVGTEQYDSAAKLGMNTIQSLIVEIRALRKEMGVEEKDSTPVELRMDSDVKGIVEKNREFVERLAKVNDLRFVPQISPGLSLRTRFNFDLAVIYERTIDVPAERERLTKDITKYEKGLAAAERQLGNEGFLAKAPANVVEGLKKQQAETKLLLDKAQAALNELPRS
jgi:valyl-tRNA synthetase